jgi:2,3-bisphosphoglycerate-independent phosphoglycerate mutase
LDGWGLAPAWGGNAIEMAETPNMDNVWKKYPHTELKASEEAVGLPHHEAGNSEVGHLNIGSGQVVFQNLPGITATINDGSFFKNPVLIEAIDNTKKNNSNLQIIGLTSDGGIHAHINHLFALLKLAKDQGAKQVYIHMITDGRDTDPMKALSYATELKTKIQEIGIGEIESVMGRFYAMDRDKHYDRTSRAYEVLTEGIGGVADSAERAISENYRQNKTDEFIQPMSISSPDHPFTPIKDNDSVIFFNYRAERARQLTEALTQEDFRGFRRRKIPKNIYFATFAFLEEYAKNSLVRTVFHLREIKEPIAKVISDAGLKQLHIAETEKYAHVTYFFNGSHEQPYPGEERILVPSPKVATFDLRPEMSADGVTKAVLSNYKKFDFIVCNFANPDMVGHTGNIKATIRACEKVDEEIGRIVNDAVPNGYVVIITADHGNADQKINPNNSEPFTEHTTSPVPFIICSKDPKLLGPLRTNDDEHGKLLSDIAPTILDIMKLERPKEMTGITLLQN